MNDSARGKLRVLILDDHAVVRQGVRQILAESFDRLEFDEGKAGLESLELALSQSWAVVIVALDLPDREGLEMLAILKGLRPHQPILVLAFRAGHFAIASTPDEMVSAVRRLVASGTIGQTTGPMEAAPGPEPSGGPSTAETLSKREREVLRLIGLGRAVKEIAADLALSETTISTYRSRILIKLGLKSTADLIRYAVRNRLAD